MCCLCLERAVSANASAPSLADPPPPVSVGTILRPFTTRADMLEDFLDRDSTSETSARSSPNNK